MVLKKIQLTLLALLLAPSLLSAEATDLTFKLGFVKKTKTSSEAVPFSRPLTLVDGDQFQLFVSPASTAYLLVLYEDTEGVVQPLFDGQVNAGQLLNLPSDDQAFSVTPPQGTEKIHVIISLTRQKSLEAKVAGNKDGKGSVTVLDELARLKTSLSSLAEAPEKPVAMGGTTRAIPSGKISEFRGQATYVKTIRFDH